MIDRRFLLQLTAGVAASTIASRTRAAAPAQAPADLPGAPANAREARLLWARLVGDLSGRPVYFFTHGSVWGFKPQADDLTIEAFVKRLYGYSGVVARQMKRQPDGGIEIRQKAWAFYRDPISDAITDKIPNPYTGVVDTAAPLSGPASKRMLDLGPDKDGGMPYGMRIRRLGRTGIVETSSSARFKSADISWYKLEANLEDYVCAAADLDNPAATHIPNRFNQNLVAEWQTWTRMHGQPGHILFKGNGEPLHDIAAIPQDQIAAIERFFPNTLPEVRGWS